MARLSKAAINFGVDCLLLAILVCMLGLSAVMHFVFPPGTQAKGWTLWGMGYDEWSTVRSASIGVLALCVLLHLILHWTWIVGFIVSHVGRRAGQPTRIPPDGIRTIYGVSLLIAILTLICTWVGAAWFSIVPPY